MRSGIWLAWLPLVTASAACIDDDLVRCSDGRMCPVGTRCDLMYATCVKEGSVSVPPDPIELANVGCGQAVEVVVPVTNLGEAPIDIAATVRLDEITVVPEGASLEPGATLELVITARPDSVSIPGTRLEALLEIATPTEVVVRPVRFATSGTLITAEARLDLGERPVDGSASRSFFVRNFGTEPTTMTIDGVAPPFHLAGSSSIEILPGTILAVPIDLQGDGIVADHEVTASFSFTGNHCQPPPSSLVLTARLTGDPLLASHTLLDFGNVACGAGVATQTLTLTSQLATAQQVAPSVSTNAFMVAPPSATVGPGPANPAHIMVTRRDVSAPQEVGLVEALLELQVPGSDKKQITLRYDIVAPKLGLSSNTGTITQAGGSAMFTISNFGNAVGWVRVEPPSVELPDGTRYVVSPSEFTIGAQGVRPITITHLQDSGQPPSSPAMFRIHAHGACSSSHSFSLSTK